MLGFLVCRKLSKPAKFDRIRVLVVVLATILVWSTSYNHLIYHWIRGKAFIKLYSLMVMIEISDLMLRQIGHDLSYTLARDIYFESGKHLMRDTVLLTIYTAIHT